MSHFEQIDLNGNGEISVQEWQRYNHAMGISSGHARKSFKAMDANGDGVVSFQEFKAYIREFYFSTEDKLRSSILYGPLI